MVAVASRQQILAAVFEVAEQTLRGQFRIAVDQCLGDRSSHRGRLAGFVMMAPFYDQGNVYNNLMSDPNPPWLDFDHWNHPPTILVCPSDSTGSEPTGKAQRGLTNYSLCGGDALLDSYSAPETGSREPHVIPSRGLFGLYQCYSIRDIPDGTSNTIAMSERIRPTSPSGLGMVSQTVTPDPLTCRAQYNPGTQTLDNPFINDTAPGFRWGDGGAFMCGFNTILPPNSASCFGETPTTMPWRLNHTATSYFTASSRHVGGVQVLLADGSARFLSENIDSGNLSVPPPDANGGGASAYGVWGALGIRAGGEVVGVF